MSDNILESGLSQKEVFFKALNERPQSLQEYFPYDEYLEEYQFFRNKDGSLGAVFELELIEHEAMTIAELQRTVADLKPFLSLPENCVLQIAFDQRYVSELDNVFVDFKEKAKKGNEVARQFLNRRIKMYANRSAKQNDESPKVRDCILSIRFFPKCISRTDRLKFLKSPERILFDEMKDYLTEMKRFHQIVNQLIINSSLSLKQLSAQELLERLRKFFNPVTSFNRKFAQYNSSYSISEQIVYSNPRLTYEGIEREGLKSRTITLKVPPSFCYSGGTSYFTKLNFPYKLSLSFSFPTKSSVKRYFDIKAFFLQNTPSAKAKRQKEDLDTVMDRLARGDRVVNMTFSVIVEGKDDAELEARTQRVINVFHSNLECEVIVESDIGCGLCLNSLPLMYSPETDFSARRSIRILREDATKFLPIFDSYKGVGNGSSIVESREGNLIGVSLKGSGTSGHIAVVGRSGSGKSKVVIDLLLGAKREEPLIFVIDKKSSYLMFSKVFNGDLTVFGEKMPFSPFRGEYDNEKARSLAVLLSTAVQMASPKFNFTLDHRDIIERAIKLAYLKKEKESGLSFVNGDLRAEKVTEEVEIKIDDFITELSSLRGHPEFERKKEDIEDLLGKFKPFYDGTYAEYFRNPEAKAIDPDQKCFFYDLDELDSDPILRTVMTLAIFEEIKRIRKLPQNVGRPVYVVIEELGRIGANNKVAADIISDLAETGRKLGISLISLTPDPRHYFENQAGLAMWNAADRYLFLECGPDALKYLKEKSDIFDEATIEMVDSLKTIPGKHSEALLINKQKTEIGAFINRETSEEVWLSPTNAPAGLAASQALENFNDDGWKAIEYLAEKYPSGAINSN